MATIDVVDVADISPGQGENLCTSQPANTIGPMNLADRIDSYQSLLETELQPRSVLQSICVSELARHAAGMELGSAAEAATLKYAAEKAAAVQLIPESNSTDSGLVAAVTRELMVRASRLTARHVRAFHAALDQMRDISRIPPALVHLDLFPDEDACTRYLYLWQKQQLWSCPACGSSERCWLRSRARFECQCGKQFSARLTTLFTGSHVPLLAWFRVVISLVVDPQIRLDDLAVRAAVVRRATLRKIVRRVSDAMASQDADRQLAGLPLHVFEHLRQVSQGTSALCGQFRHRDANVSSPLTSKITDISQQLERPWRPR